jgi:predicted permease
MFALVAILSLALGIAGTTTAFSLIDAVLMRPLPYPEAERLYAVWATRPGGDERGPASYLNFLDWQAADGGFASMMAFRSRRFNVTGPWAAERVGGALVSAEFFRTLGIAPAVGRWFAPGEDRKGRDAVAVISYDYWRRELRGDPRVVGRVLRVDAEALEVVGVAPAGFRYPAEADVWVPLSHELPYLLDSRGLQGYTVVGRLRPEVSPAQAAARMNVVAGQLAEKYPLHNAGWSLRLESLHHVLSGDVRASLVLVFGAAACVLLIAAVNVANMLLARAAARHRELATRRALGAGTGRLTRQLLTESLLLAVLGGAAGVLAASWGLDVLEAAWPADASLRPTLTLGWRVFAFALLATGGTAMVFGAGPAWLTTRMDLSAMLRASGVGAAASGIRARRLLVAAEIGLAMVLAVGGSLLARSMQRLRAVDPGFDPTNVLATRISLPSATYRDSSRVVAFYQRLLEEADHLPGVLHAAATEGVPVSGGGGSYAIVAQGRPLPAPEDRPNAYTVAVTPDYFSLLAIPRVSGRVFDARDTDRSPPVAVVNRTMARMLWPGADPVGARVSFDPESDEWIEVVGVVGDVPQRGLDRPTEPQVYLPHAQSPDGALAVLLKTDGDPLAVVGPLQAALHRIDPDIPLADPRTMEATIGSSITSHRIRTVAMGALAGVAVSLAAVGIYGVLAFFVVQRGPEMALRMALGAARRDVLVSVFRQSLRLVLPGLVLGVLGALAVARLLSGFLFQVAPGDPFALLLAVAAVLGVAVLAAAVPARRAARLDPMALLRSE